MKLPIICALFAATISSSAQEATRKPHAFMSKTNLALFSADILARTMDAQSTRRFMTDPCRCYVEKNVPWAASSDAKMYGYSIGVAGAILGISYIAHRTGHHRLERLLPSTDIPYETNFVVSNYRLSTPSSEAHK